MCPTTSPWRTPAQNKHTYLVQRGSTVIFFSICLQSSSPVRMRWSSCGATSAGSLGHSPGGDEKPAALRGVCTITQTICNLFQLKEKVAAQVNLTEPQTCILSCSCRGLSSQSLTPSPLQALPPLNLLAPLGQMVAHGSGGHRGCR